MLRSTLRLCIAVLTLSTTFAAHGSSPSCPVQLPSSSTSLNPQVESVATIFQFTDPNAWIENLAIRSNGNLLLTRLDGGTIWQLDPSTNVTTLVVQIPGQTAALGIAEYAPDIFAIAAGNFSLNDPASTVGTWNVWSLDMNTSPPSVSKIVAIPEAQFLNGLAVFNQKTGVILVDDSSVGVIFSVDIKQRAYKVAISDPSMLPTTTVQLGINGLKVFRDMIYYTSDSFAAVYRVVVSLIDGSALSAPQVFAGNLPGLDDIMLDAAGDVYAARIGGNDLLFIPASGNSSTVLVGGPVDTTVAGATAVAFGRRRQDRNVLYVTTSGGHGFPINGTFTEPGKVVAIKLARQTL